MSCKLLYILRVSPERLSSVSRRAQSPEKGVVNCENPFGDQGEDELRDKEEEKLGILCGIFPWRKRLSGFYHINRESFVRVRQGFTQKKFKFKTNENLLDQGIYKFQVLFTKFYIDSEKETDN